MGLKTKNLNKVVLIGVALTLILILSFGFEFTSSNGPLHEDSNERMLYGTELEDGGKVIAVEVTEQHSYYHNDNLTDCEYFRERRDTCDIGYVYQKVKRIAAAGGCLRPVTTTEYKIKLDNGSKRVHSITRPRDTVLLYHQYLFGVNWTEPGFLLSFKSYLVTHDLTKTKMILWVDQDDFANVMYGNSIASKFFRRNRKYLDVRVWVYEQEIQGTPLAESQIFQNDAILKSTAFKTTYSDVVRCILLHNYGGLWVDNDLWFLRDFSEIAVGVGYQFIPMGWAFNNNHIMYFYKKSPLAARVLENIVQFDYEDEKTWPVHPVTGLIEWLFNDALGLLIRKQQEFEFKHGREPAEEWLYDWNLGWLDPMWLYCVGDLDNVKEANFGESLFIQLSACRKGNPLEESQWMYHTRYPKQKDITEPGSLLDRLIQTIEAYFDEEQVGFYTHRSQKLIRCNKGNPFIKD